ncbi:MAG: hypothetical protein ACREFS_15535 [Acetobacteraceae bacterium]
MIVIDRRQIASMIPHAGTMCLLDAVLSWDLLSVRCLSRRYRCPDNPLRRADGRMGTACGLEVAAQAMAVHGRLVAPSGGLPAPGYLASVRDLWLRTARFDGVEDDLIIAAERLTGDAQGAIYRFVVTIGEIEFLSGRATVLIGRRA